MPITNLGKHQFGSAKKAGTDFSVAKGPYGEVLVVTDDFAERDTVLSLGATTSSCTGFLDNIGTALQEMDSELKHHNRRELIRFKRPPH